MIDKTVMYFITVVRKDFSTMECVGYYQDFDYAKDTLVTNQLDINETIYDYAMIEEIRNGLYPETRRWWFKFDYTKGVYQNCGIPVAQYKNEPFPYSLR